MPRSLPPPPPPWEMGRSAGRSGGGIGPAAWRVDKPDASVRSSPRGARGRSGSGRRGNRREHDEERLHEARPHARRRGPDRIGLVEPRDAVLPRHQLRTAQGAGAARRGVQGGLLLRRRHAVGGRGLAPPPPGPVRGDDPSGRHRGRHHQHRPRRHHVDHLLRAVQHRPPDPVARPHQQGPRRLEPGHDGPQGLLRQLRPLPRHLPPGTLRDRGGSLPRGDRAVGQLRGRRAAAGQGARPVPGSRRSSTR